jgi:hypothetical protein
MDVGDPRGQDEDRFKRVLDAGADIVGGASSVAAGLAIAGPPGAFAGAAAGPAVASVMKDVIHRVLSRREEKRVGGVFIAASAAYEELLANGATLRSDDFFDAKIADRSSAEEVFEGVFLAAKAEHQERKIPHLGYLMANIAVHDDLDAGVANWAIVTAESLTWTQFLLLAAIGRKDEFSLPDGDYGKHMSSWNEWGVHNQLADLGVTRREMVGAPSRKTERLNLSIFNFTIRELELRHAGLLLYQLLWLDRVPATDVAAVISSLEIVTDAVADGDVQDTVE